MIAHPAGSVDIEPIREDAFTGSVDCADLANAHTSPSGGVLADVVNDVMYAVLAANRLRARAVHVDIEYLSPIPSASRFDVSATIASDGYGFVDISVHLGHRGSEVVRARSTLVVMDTYRR